MARPREFDEAKVLDAATGLFWRQGFDATSTRELAKATGLTTASLYNAYGDKRALYQRALGLYADSALHWCRSTLSAPGPARAAIRSFFATLSEQTLAQVDPRGCLVVNAGLEMAPRDPAFQAVVADVFRQITDSLEACVARGQADGSIARDQPPADLAALLIGLMLGLRVMARGAVDPELVGGLVRATDAILQPAEAHE